MSETNFTEQDRNWLKQERGELGIFSKLAVDRAIAEIDSLRLKAEAWRCFHCGFETADQHEAEAHFGERDDAEEFTPTCTWWAKLSAEERAQEFQDLRQELNGERDESGRLNMKCEGLEHRLLEFENVLDSRFPGCRSINDIFHRYDTTEGLKLVAEQELDSLRAQLGEAQKERERVAGRLADIYRGATSAAESCCGDFKAQQVAENATLRSENERLREALRLIQWGDRVPDAFDLCPRCNQTEARGHAPDCEVGAALAGGDNQNSGLSRTTHDCGCPIDGEHRLECPTAVEISAHAQAISDSLKGMSQAKRAAYIERYNNLTGEEIKALFQAKAQSETGGAA